MDLPEMQPSVFIRSKDFINPRDISECHVAQGVGDIIGLPNLVACQRTGGLYRINTRDQESRTQLLVNKLSIKGQSVHVYNDNPYRAGITNPDDKVTKITVKDFALSKGNEVVKEFLESKGLKLTSDIQLGKVRDVDTKVLLNVLNGDRVVYAEHFDNPLPRNATISGSKVRIFHQGQVDEAKANLLCTKCYGRDHSRSKCIKPEDWCRLCQCQGHKAGEETCPSTVPEPQQDITTIYGARSALSNHFPCKIKVMGHTYESAEHAYLHTKALNSSRPELAQGIKETPYAGAAKQLSKELPFNPQWASRREEVMEDILRAKLDQVPEFGEKLLESDDTTLVGAAPGDFDWGSGMSERHTKTTLRNRWPGRNLLGRIQTRLREDYRKKKMNNEKKTNTKKKPVPDMPPSPAETRSGIAKHKHAGNRYQALGAAAADS